MAQSAQLLRLASKLNTTEHNGEQGKGCLARALAKAKLDPEQVDWASVNTHLRQATKLSSQWGVPMAMPLTKGGNVSQKWKKGLAAKARKVAWEASVKLLVPRASTLARGDAQADKCYSRAAFSTCSRTYRSDDTHHTTSTHHRNRSSFSFVGRRHHDILEGLPPLWSSPPSSTSSTTPLPAAASLPSPSSSTAALIRYSRFGCHVESRQFVVDELGDNQPGRHREAKAKARHGFR